MPLYEYACKKCNHEFEALVFPGEEAECPECRGHTLERLLSVPAPPGRGDRVAADGLQFKRTTVRAGLSSIRW